MTRDDITTFRDPTKVIIPPKYVGGYCIGPDFGQTCFSMAIKPNRFHRFMMKLFLGFSWKDF